MATVRTLIAPMAPLTLEPGMVLKLEAVDPATGAAITGVTVTRWAIYGHANDIAAGTSDVNVAGPFMLVPGPNTG